MIPSSVKLVSIIVPTYNRYHLLTQTISSLCQQSYTNIEIIIINDCSTDYSFETYKKLENIDIRIKVYNLSQNLRSAGLVRNYGINKSHGYYLAFCDDDDLWDAMKLEKQIDILEKTNYVLCSTNAYILSDSVASEKLLPDHIPNEISIEYLLKKNIIATSSVIVKKSVIKHQFSNKQYSEDYGLWLSVLKDNKAYFLNEPLIYYRTDSVNKLSQIKNQKYKVLIYQGILAYRTYKFTKLLSEMGYIVDCCYSSQDFTYHNQNLDTSHINQLIQINNYEEYANLIKNYNILFCTDILDVSPKKIQVGYLNFKNNIKTIYLIGDLFMTQRNSDNILYQQEHEILKNINYYLVVFSGNLLKEEVTKFMPQYKLSNTIVNYPLMPPVSPTNKNFDPNKIKLVLVSTITDNKDHFYDYRKILTRLTEDKRIYIDIYCPLSCLKYKQLYEINDNIKLKGNLPLYNLYNIISNYDIGLGYFNDHKVCNIVEPNKFYDYYFSKLPILCNDIPSFKKNIEDKKIGQCTNIFDNNNLFQTLDNLRRINLPNNIFDNFISEASIKSMYQILKYY